MKLNCLSCGHHVDLRDAYDDYEGPVRCFVCGALLRIRTVNGQIKRADLWCNEQSAEPLLQQLDDVVAALKAPDRDEPSAEAVLQRSADSPLPA
ncbi:MAG: hypothetical protein HY000_38035 [Planctomycetes bacterium]|nr:hypothetical protein [Planctomycetota bacterium]